MRTLRLRLAPIAPALMLVLAACSSGGDPLSPPSTGGLNLVLTGLPSGIPASVMVTGPGGFSRAMTTSGNVDGLSQARTRSRRRVSRAAATPTWRPPRRSRSTSPPPHRGCRRPYVCAAEQPARRDAGGSARWRQRQCTGDERIRLFADGDGYHDVDRPRAGHLHPSAPPLRPAHRRMCRPRQPAGAGDSWPGGVATVTYALTVPGTVNLGDRGLYLTQSVQPGDTVPLVANRDAYLRVFVRADQANTVAPAVRVRLYQGSIRRQSPRIRSRRPRECPDGGE